MKEGNTSWGAVADWYDELVQDKDSYQQTVILPNLVRLAGNVRGKQILDLACGQGFFSHTFARAGAHVTGVDVSRELIERARKTAIGARFLVGSAEQLPQEIKSDFYDIALCILALQNIKNLDAVVKETARVLKVGGRILAVLNHPCFRIPKRSSWEFDENKKVQYRRLDGYLSESETEIVMHPGKRSGPTTRSFHRPLQLYMKTFAKHGFVLTRLEEWISDRKSVSGPRQTAESRARHEFPLFLYLGLVKTKENLG